MVTNHSRAIKLLSALLILLLSPGWAEIVENVDQLLQDGHLAHSQVHISEAEGVKAQVQHD